MQITAGNGTKYPSVNRTKLLQVIANSSSVNRTQLLQEIAESGETNRTQLLQIIANDSSVNRTELWQIIAGNASGPQSLTNVEKLLLDPATPVWTQVSVTDGFVVSGFGDARDGFYFYHPADTSYYKTLPIRDDGSDLRAGYIAHSHWGIGTGNDGYAFADDGEEEFPWTADWSDAGITLTHPAAQTLAAPSTAQGGVFVSGGTQDGVMAKLPDQVNGKDAYGILGGSGDPTVDGGILWDGVDRFNVYDATGTIIYYAIST